MKLTPRWRILSFIFVFTLNFIVACTLDEQALSKRPAARTAIPKEPVATVAVPKNLELKLLDIELQSATFEAGINKKLSLALSEDGKSRLLPGGDLLWISSDETVLEVSRIGIVKALKEGF